MITIGLTKESIKAYTDQKYVAQSINKELVKASQEAAEGASSVCEIKRLLKKMKIHVIIEYTHSYPKKPRSFNEDPQAALILKYNRKAKRILKQIKIN